MIIFRYLAKEVIVAFIALTAILLLIFLSNQFVQYIGRAAAGGIATVVILKLMMLEIPNLLGLILPLGFYVAILIAYGRLYADSEMVVLSASGYSDKKLLTHTLALALIVSVITGALTLGLGPHIAKLRATLLRQGGVSVFLQTMREAYFRTINGGKDVFYVAKMDQDKQQADDVFVARKIDHEGQTSFDIVRAKSAQVKLNARTKMDELVLDSGAMYRGVPGKRNFTVTQFLSYVFPIPTMAVNVADDDRTLSTEQLLPFNNLNLNRVAELQWRISIPMMVLILALMALPLSRVKPREGKFAKLLPAILIYIVYANFMFVGRDWLRSGTIPWWLGLWWLHALMLLLAIWLFYRSRRAT